MDGLHGQRADGGLVQRDLPRGEQRSGRRAVPSRLLRQQHHGSGDHAGHGRVAGLAGRRRHERLAVSRRADPDAGPGQPGRGRERWQLQSHPFHARPALREQSAARDGHGRHHGGLPCRGAVERDDCRGWRAGRRALRRLAAGAWAGERRVHEHADLQHVGQLPRGRNLRSADAGGRRGVRGLGRHHGQRDLCPAAVGHLDVP